MQRPRVVGALAILPLSLLVLACADDALSWVLAGAGHICRVGDALHGMLGPFAVGLVGALGGLLACAVGGRPGRWLDRSLRPASLVALLAGSALVVWALVRAAAHPELDVYLTSLHVPPTLSPPPRAALDAAGSDHGAIAEFRLGLAWLGVSGVEVSPRAVTDTLRPPKGWTRRGIAGVLFGGFRQYRRRSVDPHAAYADDRRLSLDALTWTVVALSCAPLLATWLHLAGWAR